MRLLVVLFGYLCGSIPWGVLLARRAGVDVRHAGSGNIGATNVARTAGARLGVATLVADAAKGAVPTLVGLAVEPATWLAPAAGVAAFLGHLYPPTLGFKGGKGVATAAGVLAVLCPGALGVGLGVFALVLVGWRYVSLASVLAALALVPATLLLGYPRAVSVAALGMAAFIVARHRDNFRRLRAGTESRFRVPGKQALPGN